MNAKVTLGLLGIYALMLLVLAANCTAWAVLTVAAAVALATVGLSGEGLAPLTDALGNRRLAIYLASVATVTALMYVVVPITTFLTSPGEFSIHFDQLIKTNMRDAMVSVYVAAALYALAMSSRMRTALAMMALCGLVASLVYAYVLPFGYPMMTGLTFEQFPVGAGAIVVRALVDAACLAVIGLGVCAALTRFGGRRLFVAIVLIDVSLGIGAFVAASKEQIGTAGGPEAIAAAASDKPLRFSTAERNVLIVFLDRFMGSFVESVMESDPEIAERLDGFVWYPRSVSAGENSIAGVHPIFGGYDYIPREMNKRGKSLRDVSAEAYAILPYNFSRNGYEVNFVGPRGLGFTLAGDCSFLQMSNVNCTHIPLSVSGDMAKELGFPLGDLSKANYADLLVMLAAMRSAPYGAKEVLRARGPWLPFMDHSAGTTFRAWAELKALPQLTSVDSQAPQLNIVTNILPHEPYYMGEDCMPRRERYIVSRDELERRGHTSLFSLQHEIAARCALLLVADYMEALKQHGVYANTKIVIVSDHGIVGPVEDRSSRALAGGTEENLYVRMRPLMLVKEVGATGPLRISEEFMPNAETPRIVCEEIGGCINPYLAGRSIEALGRDDPFHVSFTPWQFSKQNLDSFVIEREMTLTGKDPFAAAAWTETE